MVCKPIFVFSDPMVGNATIGLAQDVAQAYIFVGVEWESLRGRKD